MPLSNYRVIVVGAGITGLCCAHRLLAMGIEPLVLEASHRVGGRIRTIHEDGFEFEAGPNTLMNTSPILMNLIKDLGLCTETILSSPVAKKRYVLLNGVLEPLPSGPISAITSPLLGPQGIIELLTDLFRIRPADVPKDESVDSFIRRRFGHRIMERLVRPFLSGIYAGEPKLLEARSVLRVLVEMEEINGSIIRGMLARHRASKKARQKSFAPKSISFNGGLARLPETLAKILSTRIRTNAAVSSIRVNDIRCNVTLSTGEELIADRVVLATEPHVAARLISGLPSATDIVEDLTTIPAADISVVGLAYRRSEISHPLDGFGYLGGPGTPGPVLGCLFRSSIFPDSAPSHSVLLTCFLGGALHRLDHLSNEQIVEAARSELRIRLGAIGTPSKTFITRWTRALTQFNRGHWERRNRIETWSRQSLVSIICSGVYNAALPKCVESGWAEAERLTSIISNQSEVMQCVPASF